MVKRLIVWTLIMSCFAVSEPLQGKETDRMAAHRTFFERRPYPANPAEYYPENRQLMQIEPAVKHLSYDAGKGDSDTLSSPGSNTVAYANSGTYPPDGQFRASAGNDRPPGEWLELSYSCLSNFEAGEVFDPIPATFTYILLPRNGNGVWLTAHIPDWKRWTGRYDSLRLFCNDRHLSLAVENPSGAPGEDTLSLPLFQEKGVLYKCESLEDEKPVMTRRGREENHAYRITVKNNRPFTVPLTIRECYPVSVSPEINVYLTESDGADIREPDGFLTWDFLLAPGQEQSVTFAYTVTYPKQGRVNTGNASP